MSIHEFIDHAKGSVRIHLIDGTTHTGHFRTDILTPSSLSAYFFGDDRDMSLPIHLVVKIEALEAA
jgi:hypothetical protein